MIVFLIIIVDLMLVVMMAMLLIFIIMMMKYITIITSYHYRSHHTVLDFPIIIFVIEPCLLRSAALAHRGGGSGTRKRAAAPPVSQVGREANESLVTCRIAFPTLGFRFCYFIWFICFLLAESEGLSLDAGRFATSPPGRRIVLGRRGGCCNRAITRSGRGLLKVPACNRNRMQQ